MDALYLAFTLYLDEGYDQQRVIEMLSLTYNGETSRNEVEYQLRSIVTCSPIKEYIDSHREELVRAMKNEVDRQVILCAITTARYPFCYNILWAFATQFRLQDEVNTALMKRVIGNMYGMNIKMDKAYHSGLSCMVEAKMIDKVKEGVYQAAPVHVCTSKIAYDIWVESFFQNSPNFPRENEFDLIFEPFMKYVARS